MIPEGTTATPTTAQRIVAATLEVVAARGIADVRVEDLLIAADVSRRTFYKHFRGKDEVVAEIYERVTTELAAVVGGADIDLDDPLAGVRNAVDAYLTLVFGQREVLRWLMPEATRVGSALYPIRARFRERLVRVLELIFAATSGRRADRYVFLALISALEGLCIEAIEEGA
jgi:AcrR family transcriptional regulator